MARGVLIDLFSVFFSITDHADCMVGVSMARGVLIDLFSVLPQLVRHFKGNTKRARLECVNMGCLPINSDRSGDFVSFHGVRFPIVVASAVSPRVVVIPAGCKSAPILSAPLVAAVDPASVTSVTLALEYTVQ